jgi:hypothetical protein
LRDKRGEPAGLGKRIDECLGVTARFIDGAMVFVWKVLAKVTNCIADLNMSI